MDAVVDVISNIILWTIIVVVSIIGLALITAVAFGIVKAVKFFKQRAVENGDSDFIDLTFSECAYIYMLRVLIKDDDLYEKRIQEYIKKHKLSEEKGKDVLYVRYNIEKYAQNYDSSANNLNTRCMILNVVQSRCIWWMADPLFRYGDTLEIHPMTYVFLEKDKSGEKYVPWFYNRYTKKAYAKQENAKSQNMYLAANTHGQLMDIAEEVLAQGNVGAYDDEGYRFRHEEPQKETYVSGSHLETRTVNTGEIEIKSNSYRTGYIATPVTQRQTTTVKDYSTRLVPGKFYANRILSITPQTKKEKELFERIIENQTKICGLHRKYHKLGVFEGEKKQEIAKTVADLLEFSQKVVFDAIVKREGRPTIEKSLIEDVEKAQKEVSEAEAGLSKASSSSIINKIKAKITLKKSQRHLSGLLKRKEAQEYRLAQLQKFHNEIDEYMAKI